MSMRSDRSPTQSTVRAVYRVTLLGASIICAAQLLTQTRSVRDTATAYAARLNARGLPANTNPARQRLRPELAASLTAAFRLRSLIKVGPLR